MTKLVRPAIILHSLLNFGFRYGIDVRRCFVQNQDLWICQERTGNGNQLFLTCREDILIIGHKGFIALWQAHDKVVDMGGTSAVSTISCEISHRQSGYCPQWYPRRVPTPARQYRPCPVDYPNHTPEYRDRQRPRYHH